MFLENTAVCLFVSIEIQVFQKASEKSFLAYTKFYSHTPHTASVGALRVLRRKRRLRVAATVIPFPLLGLLKFLEEIAEFLPKLQ